MSTGPSWKHSGGKPNNRPTTSRKAWQPGKPVNPRTPINTAGRYRRRVVAAAAGLGVLIALIVAAILLIDPKPKPTLVVVAPAGPASTAVPLNAASGAADLAAEFKGDQRVPHAAKDADPAATVDTWQQHIDANTKKPIVLHFACPGAADKEGPFLWFVPADAPAAGPGHRLKVSTVLAYLKNLRHQPPVLLILDAATEPAAWARGQLFNDFARQLKTLDADIKAVPNLVVICSADDDQRSWVAEERKQTAFAHFLREGLRGVETPANEPVTAAGLFAYLQKKVPQWAQANRDAAQTPFMLPTPDADAGKSGPARAENLVLVPPGPDEAKPSPLPADPGYPEALQAYWVKALDRATTEMAPPPEAIAPHLWRQYLDLLLKADRTARATRDVPQDVYTRLDKLESLLNEKPWDAEPPCVPYALPAAAALWVPRNPLPDGRLQTVLAAGSDTRMTAWKKLLADANLGDPQRPEARLAGADALLRDLTRGPKPVDPAALGRAAEFLKFIDAPPARPVEAHLVLLFQKFLKDRDPDLVRRALGLQITAEEAAWFGGPTKAYPHAEQVVRWFGERLEELDVRRRELTDLVFAGAVETVPGTGTPEVPAKTLADALEDNRKEYAKLSDEAAKLGAAYRLRDRVLSRLPYYARSVAARLVKPGAPDPVLPRVEALAGLAHALADKLEAPTTGDTADVLALADDLRGTPAKPGFDRFVDEFDAHCAGLAADASLVPSNWHAIDAALQVPFVKADVRANLIARSRAISQDLEAKGALSGADPSPAFPKEMAQRQARLAVAVLGHRGLSVRATGPTAVEVGSLIANPNRPAWWESLTAAGAEVGAAFGALPGQAADRAKKGTEVDPAAATVEVQKAAALARLVDGATDLRDINPVAVERRYWTHLLLVGQAKRTAADNWANLGAGPGYSATAAQMYLDSAKKVLFSKSSVPEHEREKWTTNIPKTLPQPRFDLETRARFAVTNQPEEKLRYTVTPKGGAAGYPLIQAHSVKAPVEVKKAPAGATDPFGTYVPVGRFAGKEAAPQAGEVALGLGQAADGTKGGVTLDLLYRGWMESRPVVAEYAGTPTYKWVYTPPRGPAKFAFVGDDLLRDGSVAILLDVSKSMLGPEGAATSKYQRTIDALREILKRLPRETMVSLHFFAGADGDGETLTTPKGFGLTAWDDTKAELLYQRIKDKTPDGDFTPISVAIDKALKSDQVFDPRATGHRSLIVLTDGAQHNPPFQDWRHPDGKPGAAVIQSLAEYHRGNKDVALHLVMIGVTPIEYKNARTQFGAIEREKFNDRTRPTIWPKEDPAEAGKALTEVKETAELVEILRESMFPRVSVRDRKTGVEVGRVAVSTLTPRDLQWLRPVPAGDYELHVAQSGRAGQVLQLEAGDPVLLKLQRVADKFEFSLPSYADVLFGSGGLDRKGKDADRVQMTVARNYLTARNPGYDLELTATLESPLTVDRRRPEGQLFRVKPRFVWFEVAARDAAAGRGPTQIRVENLHHRWAPAWQVTAGPWVPRADKIDVTSDAALATVDGYWLDTDADAADRLALSSARADLPGGSAKVMGGDVVVRKTVGPGFLRIDLTHPPGQSPVIVRLALDGVSQRWTVGEEHLFFENATTPSYTATFTGLTEADLNNKIALEFYAVAEVKRKVVTAGTKLTVEVQQRASAERPNDKLPEEKFVVK